MVTASPFRSLNWLAELERIKTANFPESGRNYGRHWKLKSLLRMGAALSPKECVRHLSFA